MGVRVRTSCYLAQLSSVSSPSPLFFSLIHFLISIRKENPSLSMLEALRNGQMPIHKAAIGGNPICVDLLAIRGVKLDVPDKRGRTPMALATEHGFFEVVEVNSLSFFSSLLSFSLAFSFFPSSLSLACSVFCLCFSHSPPFLIAVLPGQVLLRYGVSANFTEMIAASKTYKNRSNKPILHQAAHRGFVRTVQLFIDKTHGAEAVRELINTPDNRKMCPLQWAADGGHLEVIKLLLSKGAEINAGSTTLPQTEFYFILFYFIVGLAKIAPFFEKFFITRRRAFSPLLRGVAEACRLCPISIGQWCE